MVHQRMPRGSTSTNLIMGGLEHMAEFFPSIVATVGFLTFMGYSIDQEAKQQHVAKVERVHQLADTNNDGFPDHQELQTICREMGLLDERSLTTSELKHTISHANGYKLSKVLGEIPHNSNPVIGPPLIRMTPRYR